MSFLTLEIARTAMNASRAALEITSQNVANASTPGYIRQRPVLAPLASEDPSGNTVVGGGVTVATVERLRDQCLEAQIIHQEGQLGQEQALSTSLGRVESFFSDLSKTGIGPSIGTFFNSLEELQITPGSTTARDEVFFNAETVCTELKSAVTKLEDEKSTLETDLLQRVERVNSLVQQVAELNGKISSLGDNPNANDLRVTREESIRELGSLCGAMGMDQAGGAQDVLIGGIRLVQGNSYQTMTAVADPTDPNRHTISIGSLDDVPGLGGAIAGDIKARDTNLADWKASLDELASGMADAINAQHRAGYDLNGDAGGDFFTYDAADPSGTLAVSAALAANPRLFAASSTADGVPGDGVNAGSLAALRSASTMAGNTQTIEEFHSEILFNVGSEAQRAKSATTAREGLLSALDAQYTNQAGVSLDEEAVDVMRYQQTYNAATRLIKVANEMLQSLMDLM